MSDLQNEVRTVFRSTFGRTPLQQRLEDIQRETVELGRYTDVPNLREELGDVLSSAIMLADEMEEDYEVLVRRTLEKIKRRAEQYKSLGRKRAVAILGGAFDPPTLGHIDVAKYVLDVSRTFDEVWLMPCYTHMFNKEMALPEHRLAMCEIAIRSDRRIRMFDYEIRKQLSSETYQTVKMLLSDELPYDFSWIIGMDNANTFHTWVNAALLERLIRFVIVPRSGYDRDPKVDWYLKPPHIFLGCAEREIREVSSTAARNCIAELQCPDGDFGCWDELKSLIDWEVWVYIKKHKLYGLGDG